VTAKLYVISCRIEFCVCVGLSIKMKKTTWNILLTLPMSLGLLILAASTKTLASERGRENETTDKETLLPVSINIPTNIPKSDNVTQIIAQKNLSKNLRSHNLHPYPSFQMSNRMTGLFKLCNPW
jgi:hypothetical protein